MSATLRVTACVPGVARMAPAAAGPAKAFFGQAKALRASAVTIRSRTTRQVVKMAVRAPHHTPLAVAAPIARQGRPRAPA
jgi:hypothetical protein